MLVNVKQKAPDFSLLNQNNEIVDLKDLNTKLILFFYPKDNTPGCTKEAISFSKNKKKISNLGYHIYGISKDSIKKHQNFIEKQSLTVELLSDENKKTCEEYGVWVEKSMYGRKYFGIERTTFLINEKQIITKIWRKVKVTNHVEEVISFIENN